MLATPSPSADAGLGRPKDRPSLRKLLPLTLQARLSLAFVGVVALTLFLVAALLVNRLDDYFLSQGVGNLEARGQASANVIRAFTLQATGGEAIVLPNASLNPDAVDYLNRSPLLQFVADQVAQANVTIRFGVIQRDSADLPTFSALPAAQFGASLTAEPQSGQSREQLTRTVIWSPQDGLLPEWAIEVTLSDPYTFRASTIAAMTGLLFIGALIALTVAIVVAAFLAQRFTRPIRRLTDAARGMAEGDLAQRVPASLPESGAGEIAELGRQFNAMAARLQESMEIIRRDRDRSRDFLADVSHELRTPLAALRTFNELLQEGAAEDPAARAEFLESSRLQLERLDWLAQNLLELSKLDSGLLLLDLRPDDLRVCVESAIEQAEAAARKRGVRLALTVPDRPVRIRHDPQRIGQVVGNLVGNALKFTARGGAVTVVLRPYRDGAQVEVADTGVGIDATELPHIFERFYRGSLANEARSSGSGLGLAIVRSIVDMHRGRIAVESRLGHGSTFVVTLPRDPRSEGAGGETAGGEDSPAAADPAPGAPPVDAPSSARLEAEAPGDGEADGSAEVSNSSPAGPRA